MEMYLIGFPIRRRDDKDDSFSSLDQKLKIREPLIKAIGLKKKVWGRTFIRKTIIECFTKSIKMFEAT